MKLYQNIQVSPKYFMRALSFLATRGYHNPNRLIEAAVIAGGYYHSEFMQFTDTLTEIAYNEHQRILPETLVPQIPFQDFSRQYLATPERKERFFSVRSHANLFGDLHQNTAINHDFLETFESYTLANFSNLSDYTKLADYLSSLLTSRIFFNKQRFIIDLLQLTKICFDAAYDKKGGTSIPKVAVATIPESIKLDPEIYQIQLLQNIERSEYIDRMQEYGFTKKEIELFGEWLKFHDTILESNITEEYLEEQQNSVIDFLDIFNFIDHEFPEFSVHEKIKNAFEKE